MTRRRGEGEKRRREDAETRRRGSHFASPLLLFSLFATRGPLPSGGQIPSLRDGSLNLQVRLDGQTLWLTQAGMAELFQTTPQNITLHIRNIYDDGEQSEQSTCKEYLQVRQERERQVQRALKHYNLDMILAVG